MNPQSSSPAATLSGGIKPDGEPICPEKLHVDAQLSTDPKLVLQVRSESRGTREENNNAELPDTLGSCSVNILHATIAPPQTSSMVGLIYDQSMEEHFGPKGHVECPGRTATLFARLNNDGLLEQCVRLQARQATKEELLAGHTQQHIEQTDAATEVGAAMLEGFYQEGDMFYCQGTAPAARMAAGCCIEAVTAVVTGQVAHAMAVVRPPGHHAVCDRAMGFCFFNNVALAALAALKEPGIQRVAILDWDVHHGNGIQDILYGNPDALYISIHRGPPDFFPFDSGFADESGKGAGQGFNINIPWSQGQLGDVDYEAAFELIVEPVLSSYNPDLIIVSAGFDAAAGDPLGGCYLTPAGYAHMTKRLLRLASGKLVLALEGGYNHRVTAECASACVSVLLGAAPPALTGTKAHEFEPCTIHDLRSVQQHQQQFWPCLSSDAFESKWSELSLLQQMAALATTDKEEKLENFVITKKSLKPIRQSPPRAVKASGREGGGGKM